MPTENLQNRVQIEHRFLRGYLSVVSINLQEMIRECVVVVFSFLQSLLISFFYSSFF